MTRWYRALMAMLVVGIASCASTRKAPRAEPEKMYSPSAKQYTPETRQSQAAVMPDEEIPGRSIVVAWDANSEDEKVIGYRVYIGELQVADVSETTAMLEGLKWGDVHTLTVTAYNAAGKESERSEPLDVSPPPLVIDGEIEGSQILITVDGWPGAELAVQISANMKTWVTIAMITLDQNGDGEYSGVVIGRRGFWRVKQVSN